MTLDGDVAPQFARVHDTFAANFSRDDEFTELGAAVTVYVGGARVVDLRAGFKNPQRTERWSAATLVNVWSATKGILALAIAQLVDLGQLDYQQRVSYYWPEFAASNKGDITVAHVVSHQAGLNGFAEPTSPEDLFDWPGIVRRLERQAPFWPAGTMTSYHGMTFGWLTGELVRRVSGLEVRDYVRRHIAQPLGADVWIGCPPERRSDVAEIIPPPANRTPPQLNDIARRAIVNPVPDASAANAEAWRSAQIPAVNGHCTSEGLARIYAALANGGELEGVRIISPRGVSLLQQVLSSRRDEFLGERHWGAGVALNISGIYGPDARAFGHSGWGGSFGCANSHRGLAIAYVTNRMGSQLSGDPRARSLCEAVYASAT